MDTIHTIYSLYTGGFLQFLKKNVPNLYPELLLHLVSIFAFTANIYRMCQKIPAVFAIYFGETKILDLPDIFIYFLGASACVRL